MYQRLPNKSLQRTAGLPAAAELNRSAAIHYRLWRTPLPYNRRRIVPADGSGSARRR
jgi:hypothetical protein